MPPTVVSSGQSLTVLNGQTSAAVSVLPGGVLGVNAGGRVTSTSLAGTEYIAGADQNTTVLSGGNQVVSAGATAIADAVFSGGRQLVSGKATGTTLSGVGYISGGYGQATASATVVSGGELLSAVVGSGGVVTNLGGLTSGTVYSGGSQLSSGGLPFATAFEIVLSGGISLNEVISSGGSINVSSGGSTVSANINGFLATDGSSGVFYGAYENVFSGGVATGTTLGSGGQLIVRPQGNTSNTLVTGGGLEVVSSGGVANETVLSGLTLGTVRPNARQVVVSGGLALGTVVESGGQQVLSGGGATNTSVGLGGAIDVQTLAFASGGTATVNSADVLTVIEGGAVFQQQLAGSYAGEAFSQSVDSTGSGTLLTVISAPTISQITPTSGSDLGNVTVTVSGADFNAKDQVSIVGANGAPLAATQVSYVNSGQLWATFNLKSLPVGAYQVQVSDGVRTTLSPGSFQVNNNAAGQLSVILALPQTTSEGTRAVGTVTYTNTGATDIAAPLLAVSSDQALIEGLGDTSSSDSIDFLGTNPNGPAGILQPGASGTYSFAYVPTPTATQSGITISVGTAQPGTATNLASDQAALKPPTVDAADWNNIYTQFEALVGGTTDSLDAALSQAATELSQAGQPTSNVATLLQYELFLASGALAGSDLVDATDIGATSSTLSLSLGRTYDGTLLDRDATGAFGDGWASTYDVTAVTAANGDVYVQSPGVLHAFTLQGNGTYSAQPGDPATLTVSNGLYRMTDGNGATSQFDAAGQLTSLTDANGNVTSLSYGSNGVLQLVKSQATAETIQFTSNAAGRITKAVDTNGQAVTYSYDSTNTLLLSASGPSGLTTYTYAPATGSAKDNALASVTTPDGVQQVFTYDAQGRLASQSANSSTGAQTYSYGSPGAVTITDALGNKTTELYGSNGTVAQVRDPLGNVTQLQTDSAGKLTGAITASGSVYTYAYDTSGNLVSYTDPLGGTAGASYAAGSGNLTAFTDQRGTQTTYTYDANGNVTGTTLQNGLGSTASYNTKGLLTSSTDADGNTIRYGYDSAGDLTSKTFSDGTSDTYTYNAAGDLTAAATSTGGATTYAYDEANRLISVTNPQGQVESYTYNASGQLASRTEPGGVVTHYTYDAYGRLAGLQDGSGVSLDRYSYNTAGELASTVTGNGAYTTYQYDADGNVTQILNSNPDGSVARQDTYTYDANGRVVQDVGTDGTWSYGYDASGELTSALFQSSNQAIQNQSISYVYDGAGNRTSQTVSGVVTSYTTDALNQYTMVGGTTYKYDKDGNLTQKTDGTGTTMFVYDGSGKLVSETGPSGAYQYAYDALGNLVSTTQNGMTSSYVNDPLSFALDGQNLSSVAQINAATGSTTLNYAFGLSSAISSGGGTSFFLSNAAGNVTGTTGSDGTSTANYDYLPFGQLLYSTGSGQNQFGFDGAFGVSTFSNGLSSTRARTYDPTTGSFLSPDPTGLSGGLNPYSYSLNDPANFADPTGLSPSNPDTLNPLNPDTLRGIPVYLQPRTGGDDSVNDVNQILADGRTNFFVDTTLLPLAAVSASGAGKAAEGVSAIGKEAKEAFAEAAGSFGTEQLIKSLNLDPFDRLEQATIDATQSGTSPTNGSGPPPPVGPTGTAGGDTHITTFDGLHYDFQAAGEFVYAANADITVQVRLEPAGGPQNPSGSVTLITQTAIGLGSDRLTFDFSRPQTFWLDGTPVALIAGQSVSLAGGTVYATKSGFAVQAATGEQVSLEEYTTTVSLGGHTSGVLGLLGNANGKAAQDLALPNGTVLTSPLTSTQLYQTFGNAWRVTQATSLFDYAAGQSTATFTIPNFPPAPVTLADLPSALVQQATQYIASLGITNPTQQQDATLDYLLADGSQTVLASDVADTGAANTTVTVQVTKPAAELLGVTGPVGSVSVGTTTVNVTFQVFLTQPSATPVMVQYAVPLATTSAELGTADLGGTLPSGSLTIAAGATSGSFTIAVPGKLRLPTETLQVGISTSAAGVTLADATAGATLVSSTAVEGVDAVPAFQLLSGSGTLTGSGTAFTLDLGTIGTDGATADIAIGNLAAAYGNNFGGSYAGLTGSGFKVVEPTLTSVAPGSAIPGPAIAANTDLGQHSETLVFDPTQSNASGYSADLAPITLTITDNVVVSTANTFSIAAVDADKLAGNRGTTPFTFLATRTGSTAAPQTLSYTVSGTGVQPAGATDFGGSLPAGTVTFAANAATALITVPVIGDTTFEPDKTFTVTLSGASNITTASATGTILSDDASPGTTTSDAYTWVATTNGNWGTASNWADTTTGANPAAIPPGNKDSVTINGGTLTSEIVSGIGYSASLTLLGNTMLSGTFGTGGLTVGTAANSGGLLIGTGSTVTAVSATLTDGPIQVSGAGAQLAVSGALNIGGAGSAQLNQLFVVSGGSVQAGSLVLTGPTYGSSQVIVDGSSSLEIGAAGGAAAGKVTIDAGFGLSGAGQISNAIIDQGTITASGGSLTVGPVTGTGQVQIGSGATLNVGGGPTASTAPVTFIGSSGTLALGAIKTIGPSGTSYALNEQGLMSGFARGDVINYYDSQAGTTPLTSVAYQPAGGGTGTLTLYSGNTVLGTLNLAGAYTTSSFQVTSPSPGSYNIALATVPSDLNGDGLSDIVFQNVNGAIDGWQLSGLSLAASAIIANPSTAWTPVATGDFNGDGRSDILYQNQNGTTDIWEMNGLTLASSGIVADPGPTWHTIATGDFNGDGKSDILFQNNDGSVDVWTMNGMAIQTSGIVANPGTAWHAISTGDFNGDGKSDILFQNDNGSIDVWEMNGQTLTASAIVANPSPAWRAVGTGDFNGDGKSDIVLQNKDGTIAVWTMNGLSMTSSTIVADPGPSWHAVAVGDYNGDGKSDILFQNDNGAVDAWLMNGTTIAASGVIANPSVAWQALGLGSMNFIDGTQSTGALNGTILADNFVFTTSQQGMHIINNFDPLRDVVTVDQSKLVNYAAIQSAETAVGGSTIITLGNNDSLTITGVLPSSLSAKNFI